MPTVQKGESCYLSDGTGTAAVDIGAIRSAALSVDGALVDVTTRDSNNMRELLAAAGIAKASINASGLITDGTQHKALLDRSIAQSLNSYTFRYGDNKTIVGSFQVTKFQVEGNYDGEQSYSATFESSGTLTSS